MDKAKSLHDLLDRLLEAEDLRRSFAAREFAGTLYRENEEVYCALRQILSEFAVTNIQDQSKKQGLVELERGATMVLDSIRLGMASEIPAAMRNETDPRCYSSALMRFVRDLASCNPIAGVELFAAALGIVRERAQQSRNHEVVAKLEEIERLFEIEAKADPDLGSWMVQ